MCSSSVNPRIQVSTTPPALYRTVYSEIEEVGWEHLLYFEKDLSLSFCILDENEKKHILLIGLPQNYPEGLPSIAADVPYIFELEWSVNSRLKDIVLQFKKHLQELQGFWCTLDSIDNTFLVVNPKQPSLASSYRQICLGNGCYLLLHIDAQNPTSLPWCRFLGPDYTTEVIRKKWKRNCRKWDNRSRQILIKGVDGGDYVFFLLSSPATAGPFAGGGDVDWWRSNERYFTENVAIILETNLPGPSKACKKQNEEIDCGICYAQYLPLDDELGINSGGAPDYTCDNPCCSRAFHTVCLRDWLHSITTTRQSFDVLFGNCPYCSDPVAVKTTN